MQTSEDGSHAATGRFRLTSVDILRGVALVAMASYHFMWDLAYFGYLDPSYPTIGWPRIYARGIASTFLFLVGFSLILAHGKELDRRKFGIRFAKVAGAAALVTAGTYIAMPEGFVYFGILHAIAAMSLIGLLFRRAHPALLVVLGFLALLAPHYMKSDLFNAPWLLWIGLATRPKVSFDYVPLLPWLAPFLFGMAAARTGWLLSLIQQCEIRKAKNYRWKIPFSYLGRHSLVFYLVHQPVLISIVYLVSLVAPAPKVDPSIGYLRGCQPSCEMHETAEFCTRFCGCTLEGLKKDNLLAAFQSGAISVDNNERIKDIAIECSIQSR